MEAPPSSERRFEPCPPQHRTHDRAKPIADRATGAPDDYVPVLSLLRGHSRQAEHYDETRAASAPVVPRLRKALEGAPGRRLADTGGGTGNYALALKREGWEPVVVGAKLALLPEASR